METQTVLYLTQTFGYISETKYVYFTIKCGHFMQKRIVHVSQN